MISNFNKKSKEDIGESYKKLIELEQTYVNAFKKTKAFHNTLISKNTKINNSLQKHQVHLKNITNNTITLEDMYIKTLQEITYSSSLFLVRYRKIIGESSRWVWV